MPALAYADELVEDSIRRLSIMIHQEISEDRPRMNIGQNAGGTTMELDWVPEEESDILNLGLHANYFAKTCTLDHNDFTLITLHARTANFSRWPIYGSYEEEELEVMQRIAKDFVSSTEDDIYVCVKYEPRVSTSKAGVDFYFASAGSESFAEKHLTVFVYGDEICDCWYPDR